VAYYLGIDGGGTKTVCLVGDETRVLGSSRAMGSNINRVGENAARSALHDSVRCACVAAGIDASGVTATVAGIAGAGRVSEKDAVSRALREVLAGEVKVFTDADTTLHAAFGSEPGVIVISGTGSIALARNSQGVVTRAGGWGRLISDEGSGPWIGRAAVRNLLKAFDAGEKTELEEGILRAWGLPDLQRLVMASNADPQPDFGSLLPEIESAADSGDVVAKQVFENAGRELATLASVASKSLSGSVSAIHVAMSGGAFAHAPNLRKAFYNSLQAQISNVVLMPELADAALGALQMARKI
jgi:N-acetylglucosamine kinase-like BadF-type ATPase